MILFWLGSMIIMFLGWHLFVQNYSQVLINYKLGQINSQDAKTPSVQDLIKKSILLSLVSLSSLKSIQYHFLSYNLRISSLRSSLLGICLANLSYWCFLIFLMSLFQINSFLLLAFAGLAFIFKLKWQKHFIMLSGFALVLLGAEMSLKNSSILLNWMSNTGWGYFLTDNRFYGAIGSILLFSILTLIFKSEIFILFFILILHIAGVLALQNIAWSILGMELGLIIYLFMDFRFTNSFLKKWLVEFLILRWGLALFFILVWTSAMNPIFVIGQGVYENVYTVMQIFIGIAFLQTVFLLLWGHFRQHSLKEDTGDNIYIKSSIIVSFDFPSSIRDYLKTKVLSRLNEMRYHLQGLNAHADERVPAALKYRLESEEKQLSDIYKYL